MLAWEWDVRKMEMRGVRDFGGREKGERGERELTRKMDAAEIGGD